MSTLSDGPWQRHLWLGGNQSRCVTCDVTLPDGEKCRIAGATFSPGGSYYALSCQGKGPSVVTINSAKVGHCLLNLIASNQELFCKI